HVFFAAGLLQAKPEDETIKTAALLLGGKSPEELSWKDTLALGNRIELTVLWPEHTASDGGNEESICLGLGYKADDREQAQMRMLLTGDAESPQLESLLATEGDINFDIIKVGHHGSKDAVTETQLERMGCQLALISVGKDNRYGHPTPETLSALNDAEVAVYRTDLNGDIILRFERESFFVRCDTMATQAL
ncbi:MAG: hypothetical protein LBL27_03510, partial [Coriobacteriales bacterium]|nr:hypothetical protein [Coriobacteriales bacterium]